MSTPTGDSFFDPPPSDQSAATLILGGEQLECHLVEVSLGGFGVTVPRSTAWTGEPVCRLLTHDAAYPVRIIRQESQYTGYLFTLQRIQEQETKPVERLGATQYGIIHASCCCAVGLVAAMACCFLRDPGETSKVAQSVLPHSIANLWNRTWTSTTTGRDFADSETERRALAAAHDGSSDDLFEMPAISVSLGSGKHGANVTRPPLPSWPMTTNNPSDDPTDADPQAQAIAAATRQAQLKSSLQTARRGPSRPANLTSQPWLFPTNEPAFNSRHAFRMSEAAQNDLALFESGLKSLPAASAGDATRSLQRALLATTTSSASAAHFKDLPDVRLIRSDDAEIYFRLTDSAIEILRVVPRIDGEPITTARPTSPTSSLTPQSVNR